MEILERIFVKKDQKWVKKKSHICKYMRDSNINLPFTGNIFLATSIHFEYDTAKNNIL